MTLFDAELGNIKMFLAGDAIINRGARTYREPRYLELVEIMRGADVSFLNSETLYHNYEYPPNPHQSLIGTYMRSAPSNIGELQWMGVNMLSVANNHQFDYGEQGLLGSLRNLDAAGMVYAGAGSNLSEAREAKYITTNGGRVALIALTDSAPAESRAGDQRRDMLGRPGINWLRSQIEYTVDKQGFDELRRISAELGFEARKKRAGVEDSDTVFHLMGQPPYSPYPTTRYALGDEFGFRRIANQTDMEAILQRVRDARRMADWVIVAMHNHEGGKRGQDPGDHTVELAHRAIDDGADVFVGHGPHRDRGVEIYKGRPIFWALGDFFLENDTVFRQPHDNYERHELGWEATPADFYDGRLSDGSWGMAHQAIHWSNTVAEVTFDGGSLQEVKLLPVDLGFGRSRGTRGRPLLATGDVAKTVLERQIEMSADYGTKVLVDGDVATVELDAE